MKNQEYRTQKQFQQIIKSTTNGNWSTAFKEAEEYGFEANDLIKANETARDMGNYHFEEGQPMAVGSLTDIALISEGAMYIRMKSRKW